jgi:hypothetical protein
VIYPLARIKAVAMIRRLDLAGDATLLVAYVKARDRTGAAFAGDDVLPAGLDVTTQGRD